MATGTYCQCRWSTRIVVYRAYDGSRPWRPRFLRLAWSGIRTPWYSLTGLWSDLILYIFFFFIVFPNAILLHNSVRDGSTHFPYLRSWYYVAGTHQIWRLKTFKQPNNWKTGSLNRSIRRSGSGQRESKLKCGVKHVGLMTWAWPHLTWLVTCAPELPNFLPIPQSIETIESLLYLSGLRSDGGR